ncbi:MAG: copper chaperone PCu(A)C [Caulobacterales bacterium]|uniref:copper chaperone PCu(A)C n=1 Tax=Glycocaulis sp. TaxID=1969725 RepID=UPI003F9F75EF
MPRRPATASTVLTRLGAVSLAVALLAACSEPATPAAEETGDAAVSAAEETSAEASSEAEAPAATTPEVLAGWVRTPPGGRDVTAGYVTLRAGSEDDQLVGASSPIANRVEIHTMEDDGEVMRMRQVEAIDLPAGTEVSLAPGGDHLMFFGVDTAALDGEAEVTLEFASGATSTVRLPLSASAPDMGGME